MNTSKIAFGKRLFACARRNAISLSGREAKDTLLRMNGATIAADVDTLAT